MDTITSEYCIPAYRLPGVQAAIDKLNRRARRLKLPEITVKVTGNEIIDKGTDEKPKPVLHNRIEVTGTRPQLAGWEFAATLEHDPESGLTILRTSSAFKAAPIPLQFRKASAICDHCHTERRRKDTFLCYSESKGFKQIGRNCLVDFLGGVDPHAIAGAAEIWFDLTEIIASDADPDQGWGGGGQLILPLLEFVTRSFAVVRVRGFLGRGKAKELADAGDYRTATADRVLNLLLPTPTQRESDDWKKEDIEITENEQDQERAAAALAWVRAFDDESPKLSDYEHNLFVSTVSDFLPLRRAGIVASLPAAYLKHIDRQEELRKQREGRKPSEFVGTIGERITITATLTKVITIPDNGFGESYLHKFEEESGNRFSWFSSSAVWTEGGVYNLTGKVKAHKSDAKWGNETQLNRCTCNAVLSNFIPAADETLVGRVGECYAITRSGEFSLHLISRWDNGTVTTCHTLEKITEAVTREAGKKAVIEWVPGFDHVQYDAEDITRHFYIYTVWGTEPVCERTQTERDEFRATVLKEFPATTQESLKAASVGVVAEKPQADGSTLVLFKWAGNSDCSLRRRVTVKPVGKAKPAPKRAGEAPALKAVAISSTRDDSLTPRIDPREYYYELPVTASPEEFLAGHGNWGLTEAEAEEAKRRARLAVGK